MGGVGVKQKPEWLSTQGALRREQVPDERRLILNPCP
jgi:hypothetical protein